MTRVIRAAGVSADSCPVLSEADALPYLVDGVLPLSPHYEPVPPGKVVRRRGCWLTPEAKYHFGADLYLISTDAASMNEDEHQTERGKVLCYYSPAVASFYIGVQGREDNHLHPLLEGLFPPLPLDQLTFIGRVISAI